MSTEPLLRVTSLLGIVLLSLHFTDDIVRGTDRAGPANLIAILILLAWLVGTLLLERRRAGYVIVALGSLFAAAMPVLHLRGSGIAAAVASDGGFFFLWILFALGVSGGFGLLLALHGLWRTRRVAAP